MEIVNLKTNSLNQNNYNNNILTPEFVGSLLIYPVGITPEKCLSCDGYTLKIEDYNILYSVIGTQFNTGEEAEDEFSIPDYNVTGRFLQPGTDAGSKITAGLPGIDLALRVDGGATTKSYYNNTYLTDYGTDDYGGTLSKITDNSDEYMFLMSDATDNRKAGDLILDTEIYGNSSTVQPPSQIVHVCIRYK
ncbi:MAG: phage tail protein [Candidatus Gastranaerophilales bacterium]|nr:phage tail protein [Candidatus Gastranaerophilales bacterium]